MSQIEINVLKEANPPSKKVLSCSFFTMQDAYRDVSFYKDYLESLINKKSKLLKGFELRIYTDDSGKEIVLDLAKNHNHVSVHHYNYPAFKEGNGHTGTFGTLVRFLPLFETGLEIVWITDIDVAYPIIDPNTIRQMKNLNRDFYVNSFFCYERKPWIAGVKYPIVAYKVISFKTFPRQLLTRFITKLTNGDYKDVIENINNYNERKKPNNRFPYGMDEYFINKIFYNYLKTHDVSIYLMIGYPILSLLVYRDQSLTSDEVKMIKDFSYIPTKEVYPKIKKIMKRSIPKVVDELPCLQELLDNDKIDRFPMPEKIGWLFEEYHPEIKSLA
jgi:hypothetical protein